MFAERAAAAAKEKADKEKADKLAADAAAAAAADAASGPSVVARTVRLSSGRVVSDVLARFTGLSLSAAATEGSVPACTSDVSNSVVWAAGASDDAASAGVLALYQQPVAATEAGGKASADAAGESLRGSQWLANPQFSLSEAPGAVSDVAVVASTLMAVVDSMVERVESGKPDAPEAGAPGAPGAAAAGGKGKGKLGMRSKQEPECCNRVRPAHTRPAHPRVCVVWSCWLGDGCSCCSPVSR